MTPRTPFLPYLRTLLGLATLLLALPTWAQDAESTPDQAEPPPAEAATTEPDAPPAPPPPSALEPPPAPVPEPTAAKATNEISLQEWNRDDWQLLKPRKALFEVGGYFRLRTDLIRKLNLGNNVATEWTRDANGNRTPVVRYSNAASSAANSAYDGDNIQNADFTGANMRLRIEPTLNVTDDIHVITTFDILDNVVMGSTPNSLPLVNATPDNIAASGQVPPRRGVNAVNDAFIVKRAYAKVTALNEQLDLRFGRMPNHWGLGMMANSGDCLDCNYGDVVDRLYLSFKMADHIIAPIYDWVSNGPVVSPFGRAVGSQPVDAATWDDTWQLSVQATKVNFPEDIEDRLLAGESVLNYGLWFGWRTQDRDVSSSYYLNNVDAEGNVIPDALITNDERRNASIYHFDTYFHYYNGGLRLSFEGGFIGGTYRDKVVSREDPNLGDDSPKSEDNVILQWGGALELEYDMADDNSGTTFLLKSGFASGDPAPGFGALNNAATQRGHFRKFGDNYREDTELGNFQFSPDYHVDMILFRQIIGTVTDAIYVAPTIAYRFDENVNGRLGAVYSQAMIKRSTPSSCYYDPVRSSCDDSLRGDPGNGPLGLEFNGELAYGLLESPDGGAFRAAFAGGLLVPLGGLDNRAIEDGSGSIAWTLQTRLYVTY